MQKVFLFPETKAVRDLLNQSYEALLAALRVERPEARSLIEDDVYSQLHDLLALLRTKKIRVRAFNDEDDGERFLALFVDEAAPT